MPVNLTIRRDCFARRSERLAGRDRVGPGNHERFSTGWAIRTSYCGNRIGHQALSALIALKMDLRWTTPKLD